mmetsp:Transcript_34251/g.66915  ORF Transcript_34251/g.66915 Transcript_34251/m.66915 type:complete len:233 (-) Transcript_34251:548-1246(-)
MPPRCGSRCRRAARSRSAPAALRPSCLCSRGGSPRPSPRTPSRRRATFSRAPLARRRTSGRQLPPADSPERACSPSTPPRSACSRAPSRSRRWPSPLARTGQPSRPSARSPRRRASSPFTRAFSPSSLAALPRWLSKSPPTSGLVTTPRRSSTRTSSPLTSSSSLGPSLGSPTWLPATPWRFSRSGGRSLALLAEELSERSRRLVSRVCTRGLGHAGRATSLSLPSTFPPTR